MQEIKFWQFWRGWGAVFALCLWAGAGFAQGGWQSTQHAPAGTALSAIFFVEKRGWVGGDNGFISATDDAGKTWTTQASGAKDAINDIFFLDKNEGYFLAGAGIYATGDGGKTWAHRYTCKPESFNATAAELYTVRFVNKKRGWALGSLSVKEDDEAEKVVDSLLLRTEDGGATWQRWRVPVTEELIHFELSGDKRLWLVGANGTVIYTDSNGESWQIQRTNTQATLYHVDFRNEKIGFVVGQKGALLRTLDSGETWIPVMLPVQNTLLSVAIVNEDEIWAAGRGGVILRTTDGGVTWTPQNSRTRNNLYALVFDKKMGWAVGADGIVLQYERK
jgi:photosystem II stability/assembly factor-like uncharacterized protein